MSSLNYIIKNKRKKVSKSSRVRAFNKQPFAKGVCLKVFVRKPKKPNSAIRKVAKVKLSTKNIINASIPGEGHTIQQHSIVLIRGARVRDLPGVKFKCIRGKYDLLGVPNRRTSRSKYGTKKQKSN
jgi:small subunit ribosomal protein S12